MDYSKMAAKLRDKLSMFSGNLSHGLPKTARRFVNEIIYGVTCRQSVLLSEVTRSLGETIPFIKTENRLCRQLKRPGLGSSVRSALLNEGSSRIGDDTLLILDVSDIAKRYARKMEHLARVRDGSEGVLANGYWTMNVIGASVEGKEIIPLYGELYSQNSSGFISENHEILQAVVLVSEAVERRGIWVIDRGGDRGLLYDPLLDDKLRFIIRMTGDRHLLWRGKKRIARELAATCKTPYAVRVTRRRDGKPVSSMVEFGSREVKLPWRYDKLTMVVVKGFGAEPMMILTNAGVKKSRKAVWKIVESYIARWEIEETIRFVKQSYDIENVRVRSYEALKNLYCLLLAVTYFATAWLGFTARLNVLAAHAITAAKRFFGIPDFRYYAVADGISEILRRSGKYLLHRKHNRDRSVQPALL